MDNCYGKRDRIPRELLHSKGDRLTNKHIQTLSFLQEIIDENELLKKRKEELEKEQEKCQDIHALAGDFQGRIKDIEENCLKRADEVNQMLADQHRAEMMQVLDEKEEMERELKEEILKLRHEVESLKRTSSVLQTDTEWVKEKQDLQGRLTELELLAEGLQIEVTDKKLERDKVKTSLNQSQAQNSELHQVQELRTLNQSLTNELKETRQKNQEYAHKIDQLQQKLRENSTEEEHAKLMVAMKNKTEKLLKEKEVALMKRADAESQCEDLAALNDNIETKVSLLEQDLTTLLQEFQDLKKEQGKLHRRLQHDEDKAVFKEFWAIKRELEAAKEENEILKVKVKSSSCSLPLLKDEQSLPAQRSTSKPKGRKKLSSISSSVAEASPSLQADVLSD